MKPRTSLFFCSFSAAAMLSLSAQTEPSTLSAESVPNTGVEYRLFVGLDVEVGQDDEYALVEGYVNNRVHTEGSDKLVSLRNVDDMRFTRKTKLSRNPLKISEVKTKKIANTAKAARDAMRSQQSMQDFQSHQAFTMRRELDQFVEDQTSDGVAFDEGLLEAQIAQKESEIVNLGHTVSKIADQQAWTDKINNRGEFAQAGEPTALLITAEISSPTRINDAYIIGTASISTDDSPEEQVVFFSRVGKLDEKPRRVRIVKQGMPGEFKVNDVKMHVFRNGQEIVSNQSDKQYVLTREQTHQYLTLERVSHNRGETIDPEPAWSLAPPELFASSKERDFDYPLTVHVDANGKVTSIDPNKVVPEKVVRIVKELPFFPGLIDGEAVDSTALVNLASFFR